MEIYSEFTIGYTVGPSTFLYGSLYGLERKAGTLSGKFKSDPLGHKFKGAKSSILRCYDIEKDATYALFTKKLKTFVD